MPNWAHWLGGWLIGLFSGASVYATNDTHQWWHVAFVAALGVLVAWFTRIVLNQLAARRQRG